MSPEAMIRASELLGRRMLDLGARWSRPIDGIPPIADEEAAYVFALAAVGSAMSMLIAAGFQPAGAAAALSGCVLVAAEAQS